MQNFVRLKVLNNKTNIIKLMYNLGPKKKKKFDSVRTHGKKIMS